MRKVLKILLFIPILYILALPVYLARSSNIKPCGEIKITIEDSSDYHFVTKKQLLGLVYGKSDRIIGVPIKDIDPTVIEGRIKVLREVKDVEVFFTIDGALHINVDQRNPVMRVIPDEGGDYFIDNEGIVIRKRNLYTPRLHLVGGNINISSAMLNGISIFDTSIKKSVLKDIYQIVTYINEDDFWSALIDQIYVDRNVEIDLIPRVGNQIIHLGSAEDFRGKLNNLEVFYEKVAPEVGWNNYSVINLEFKDQIVCKKR